MKIPIALLVLSICALLFAAGCTPSITSNQNANTAQSSPTASTNTNTQTTDGSHEHTAPHGGTLIVFGEEFAHLELVLDDATGKLSAYALDAEAEKAVPLKMDELEIQVKSGGNVSAPFSVKLKAVENKLTGETKGNTSEFSGRDDKLKGLKNFDAVLKSISIKGQTFNNTEFNFPKGNEEEHGKESKEK